MNLLKLLLSIIAINASSAMAQMNLTELSGELSGTLTADKKYHVVGNVFVPPGSSVFIEAGTVIMFSEFTGLHVQGILYARGSETQPIVFTSQHDSSIIGSTSVPPAPFDWNGIDIYESAVGSELFFCNISYSVYGIRSQTDYCKINSSIFSNNGKSDFTIKDVRKEITPGVPFSYSPLQDALPKVSAETDIKPTPETIPEKPDVTNKKQGSAGKQILRYVGLALCVGGGAYSAISYFTKYKPAEEDFKQISELDEQEMRTYTSNDWNDARDQRNSSLIHTVSGAAGAVLGILSFSLSFAF